MARRTILLLGDETRAATRDLARRYGVSVPEAIRRSVIQQRDLTVGLSARRRADRARALQRAFDLFDGNDPAAEIRRLRAQATGF